MAPSSPPLLPPPFIVTHCERGGAGGQNGTQGTHFGVIFFGAPDTATLRARTEQLFSALHLAKEDFEMEEEEDSSCSS